MKALSIRQPWAHCIVGLPPEQRKPVENRTWETNFRGPFLIHTGLTMDVDAFQSIQDFFPSVTLPPVPELKTGGIVGMAEIVDCVDWHPSGWFFGPYAFVLENSRPLPFMPCKGRLSFFDVEYINPETGEIL